MTLKSYLILMSFSTLLCWAAFLMVLFYINPEEAELLGLIIFYSSLFLAMVGTLSILGFILRYWFKKSGLVFSQVISSFRQGILLAILIIGSLFLQSLELMTWWNLMLFVLGLTVLEFFFISR